MKKNSHTNKKYKKFSEEEILVCACGNPNHMIKIKYNEALNNIYCDIHLNKLSFWKRLKTSIKYLFGFDSKFGDFDEFIFDEQHAETLLRMGYRLKNIEYINFF